MKYETEYIYNIPKFSKKASIENTKEMLRRIGFDESTKKIIHIAGTNGKGSVCAYLSGILKKAGKKTGTFTSPHLVKMNERIVIDGKMVSDRIFEESFERIKKISEEMVADGYIHPSFFEFLFGMGMDIFMREKVEYIVLETGLGGRLDATNAIERPVLTVITSIGLDHTDILGDTLAEIAGEKAGIIKENVPVVFEDKLKEVTEVIEKKAYEKHARIIKFESDDIRNITVNDKSIDFCIHNKYYDNVCFSVKSRGLYQTENGALAAIAAKEVLGLTEEEIINGISGVSWTGRMQQLDNGMIIDGAHNDDGIGRFIESVSKSEDKKRILILSAVKDKHYEGMIKKICVCGLFDTIITGELDDPRGVRHEVFVKEFLKYPEQKTIHCKTVIDAYKKAMEIAAGYDRIYVAGSLYLVGEILDITKEFQND